MTTNDRLFSTRRKKRKLKDKKVSFYTRVPVVDEYGTPIRGEFEYKLEIDYIWAYVRQTSAKEIAEFKAGSLVVDYEVELLITINYRDDIRNDMLVKFKDKYYQVKRIDNFEFYKEDIVIAAVAYNPDDE